MVAVYLPRAAAFTNPRLAGLYVILIVGALGVAVMNFVAVKSYLLYTTPVAHVAAYVDGWADEDSIWSAQQRDPKLDLTPG